MARKQNLFNVLIAAAMASVLASGTTLAAVWSGQVNGRDLDGGGWTGNDNPDNDTGSYSVNNAWQNTYISEWSEPSDDWMRDRFMNWGAAAERKLNNESATHGLGTEMRIHDQLFYNYNGNFNTNLPFSKAPENEWWFEELSQGYTEVDMEIQEPRLINANFNYFWDIQIDSEKAPTAAQPHFYTEIEYCLNDFATDCWHDVTGWFQKQALVQ
ncbi:MAG TPA: hypothetical protein VLM76_11355 [Patescibacteria group bacterium]|nr:hypothetical protein [Patescibacteria group bacterium]